MQFKDLDHPVQSMSKKNLLIRIGSQNFDSTFGITIMTGKKIQSSKFVDCYLTEKYQVELKEVTILYYYDNLKSVLVF